MQIDEHLSPTDMIYINGHDGKSDPKLLISHKAEESEAILSKVHISTAESSGNSRYEKGQNFEETMKMDISDNVKDVEDL